MADESFKKCLDTFLGKMQGLDSNTRNALLSRFTSHIGELSADATTAQQAAAANAPPERAAAKVPPGGASSLKFGGDDMDNQGDVGDSNNPTSQRVKRAKEGAKKIDEEKRKNDDQKGRYGGNASSDIFGTDDAPQKVRTSTGGVRQNPGGTSTIFSEGPEPVKQAPKEVVKEVPKEPAGPISEEIVPDSLRAQVSEAVYRKGKLKDTLSKWNQNRSKVLTSEDIFNGIKGCGVDITRGHAQWFYLNFKAATPEGDGVNYSGLVRMLTVDRK